MKKLHSLAFCALITPALTLGASSVMAQQSTGQDNDRQQQTTQPERGEQQRRSGQMESQRRGQTDTQTDTQRRGQTGAQTGAQTDRRQTGTQTGMGSRGFMSAAPTGGIQASDLMGANVRSTGDDDLGSVSDLIIDQNGQVVAIIVGVGGFLGIGERDVAIGWDDVTRSGAADDLDLRVNVTRDSLRDAPEFEGRN